MKLMQDLVDAVLSGRYRLVGRLAGGGMGEVYRAHDLLLDRRVAVKILQPNLAADPELVQRFKDEARAAARLSHPGIVAVYDWGQEDEHTYYMVMEYVSGSDLRDLLVARGSLEPGQAAEIMTVVCDALAHAHRNGLVHRDIKPENVLIARDGAVKVADFGIAVVADADRTMPGGAIPGTLRYIAPEQAQGLEATAASDIWAAGAVLSELLTGRPPLLGAGTELLRRRASEQVPRPSKVDSTVPPILDDVVLRACALEPWDRYPDAAEMGASLRRISVRSLPDSDPLEHLLDELTGEIHLSDMEPTSFTKRRAPRRRRLRVGRVLAALAILVALVAGGAEAAGLLGSGRVDVPKLEGLRKAAAIARAEQAGLKIEIDGRFASFTVPQGVVLTQTPARGTLEEGATITMALSTGLPVRMVPDASGLPPDEARARIEAAGFEVGEVLRRYSAHEEGLVFRQIPSRGRAEWGTPINFVVSQGPRPVQVPDVSSMELPEAKAALKRAGLVPVVVEVYSNDIPAGLAVSSAPAAGLMSTEGAEVDLNVSLGPEFEEVTVPDVRGMTVSEAASELESLGFRVREVQSCSGGKTVAETDPVAGTTIRENDLVALFTC